MPPHAVSVLPTHGVRFTFEPGRRGALSRTRHSTRTRPITAHDMQQAPRKACSVYYCTPAPTAPCSGGLVAAEPPCLSLPDATDTTGALGGRQADRKQPAMRIHKAAVSGAVVGANTTNMTCSCVGQTRCWEGLLRAAAGSYAPFRVHRSPSSQLAPHAVDSGAY